MVLAATTLLPYLRNSKLHSLKERRFYFQLYRLLGFPPRKISLYKLAFLPKSAQTVVGERLGINNERLEYLGDAILDAIVATYLFKTFPDANEGFMTKVRARIVRRKTLDQLARKLEIPRLIRQESLSGNKSKHLYGNTLEALIGAIYLDRGYRKANRFFIRKVIHPYIDLTQLASKDPDYKSRIIEWAQKNRVEVVFKSREEHKSEQRRPSFISAILLDGEKRGTGQGSMKKEAEQLAAKEALANIKNT